MRIFLSYKVEDSSLVRGVAERLIAAGIKVWFAEYEVLLQGYPETNEQVRRVLRPAIESSTHAVAFTNQNWARSGHCNFEFSELRDRLGSSRIVEVCIPREDAPLAILGVSEHERNPIVFQGELEQPTPEDLDRLTRQIGNRLGIDAAWPSTPSWPGGGRTLSFPRYGVSLRPGPFAVTPMDMDGAGITSSERDALGQHLRFRSETDGDRLTMRLFISPLESAIGDIAISQEGGSEDRQVFRAFRLYATQYYGQRLFPADPEQALEVTDKGLHLVFLHHQSHMALTLFYRLGDRSMFERWYILNMTDRRGTTGAPHSRGELRVMFSVKSEGSEEQQFRHFCGLCPVLDRVVSSVTWRHRSPAQGLRAVLPLLLGYGILGALGVRLTHDALRVGSSLWLIGILALLTGVVGAEVLALVLCSTYRRLRCADTPLAYEASERGPLSRFVFESAWHSFQAVQAAPKRIMKAILGVPSMRLLFALALATAAFVVGLSSGRSLDAGGPSFAQALCGGSACLMGMLLTVEEVLGRLPRRRALLPPS